jgi:1-deoxy-D-xylulose 5-phosphate reductoisomerase
MKKKIVILGSTGSVGKQALTVLSDQEKLFELVGISGWEDTNQL